MTKIFLDLAGLDDVEVMVDSDGTETKEQLQAKALKYLMVEEVQDGNN